MRPPTRRSRKKRATRLKSSNQALLVVKEKGDTYGLCPLFLVGIPAMW
jgi:hypothetical protein